jgi:hypothetical protein
VLLLRQGRPPRDELPLEAEEVKTLSYCYTISQYLIDDPRVDRRLIADLHTRNRKQAARQLGEEVLACCKHTLIPGNDPDMGGGPLNRFEVVAMTPEQYEDSLEVARKAARAQGFREGKEAGRREVQEHIATVLFP